MMRFFFRENPARQELDDVRRRIAELRRDIERIEQTSRSPARQADGADPYRSVFQVRTAMALEELIQKRAELAQLMEREAALLAQLTELERPAGEPAAEQPGDSVTGPALASPRSPEETPPTAGDEPLGSEVAERSPQPPEMGLPVAEVEILAGPATEIEETPAAEPTVEPSISEWLAARHRRAQLAAPEPTVEPVAEAAGAPGAPIGAPEPQPTISEGEPQLDVEAAPAEPPLVGAPAELDASRPRRPGPSRLRTGTLALAAGVTVVVGGLGAIFFSGIRAPGDGGQPTPRLVAIAAPTITTAPTVAPPTPTLTPTPSPEPTPEPAPAVVAEPAAEPEPANLQAPAIDVATIVAPAGFRGAYLRSAPSTSGRSLGLLPNGTLVEVLEGSARASGFRWIRVRTSDGVEGWVVATAART